MPVHLYAIIVDSAQSGSPATLTNARIVDFGFYSSKPRPHFSGKTSILSQDQAKQQALKNPCVAQLLGIIAECHFQYVASLGAQPRLHDQTYYALTSKDEVKSKKDRGVSLIVHAGGIRLDFHTPKEMARNQEEDRRRLVEQAPVFSSGLQVGFDLCKEIYDALQILTCSGRELFFQGYVDRIKEFYDTMDAAVWSLPESEGVGLGSQAQTAVSKLGMLYPLLNAWKAKCADQELKNYFDRLIVADTAARNAWRQLYRSPAADNGARMRAPAVSSGATQTETAAKGVSSSARFGSRC